MSSLGLYLHVPFCQAKCGYCDFYSVAVSNRPTLPLVKAIVLELANRLADRPGPITTVFVGGGTPTVLAPGELVVLVRLLKEVVGSDRPAEFTVEVNPGTTDDAKLAVLTEAGVDRISMGAQSFHRAELDVLERIHAPEDIAEGVERCRKHGVERINLDLMFGIPGQTPAGWQDSLQRAIDLGVEHLACYGLTYEPGTRLTAERDCGRLVPCDEAIEAEMYLTAIDDLAAAGYEQYEISNFAKPGQRCLHNLIYWRNEPYIGVGPSAAGYLNGIRTTNISGIERYVRLIERDGHAVVDSEQLTGPALAGETAMLLLRLNEGLDFEAFLSRTGVDARTAFANSTAAYAEMWWLTVTDRGIALTRAGRLMADTIIADLIDEVNKPPGPNRSPKGMQRQV